MALRPKPISTDEYHDHRLTGLLVSPGQAEILIESPARRRSKIRLSGVAHLLATDFLQGNIINHIDCHKISTPDVATSVLSELRETGSQYFKNGAFPDSTLLDGCLGKIFVAVRSSYGADVYIIADSVTEEAS